MLHFVLIGEETEFLEVEFAENVLGDDGDRATLRTGVLEALHLAHSATQQGTLFELRRGGS